jgi:hypothetical protein
MFDKPKIIATLVKNQYDPVSLRALEESLTTTFYEDIITDDTYDDDLIRLLYELLEVKLRGLLMDRLSLILLRPIQICSTAIISPTKCFLLT